MRLFDARGVGIRTLQSTDGEHLLVNCGGSSVRIDVREGSVTEAPVGLHFDIRDDHRLAAQIAALRRFGGFAGTASHRHLAHHLRALAARDARRGGASLRETADLVLGPGHWPGDGEHRKSQVRRLIAAGENLVVEGPRPLLAAR